MAMSSLSRVLGDLGGGVVGAIQAGDARYAITDTKIKDTTIAYYGQNSVDCSKTSSGQTPDQQQYYKNPNNMVAASQNVLSSNKDVNSPTAVLGRSELLSGNAVAVTTCSKERTVSISSVEQLCSEPRVSGGVASRETTKNYRVKTGSHRSRNNCECEKAWSGSFMCSIPSGAQTVFTVPNGAVYIGTTAEGFFDRRRRRGDDDCSFYSYDYYSVCSVTTDVLTNKFSDTCQSLKSRPECRMQTAITDGVKTVSDFNPTQKTPPQSCQTFQGLVSSYPVCYDAWKTQETFLCESQSRFDFSDATKRATAVMSTASNGGATLQYQDIRKDNSGTWITENHSVGLPTAKSLPVCEMACKTMAETTRTDVVENGNISQNQVSTKADNVYFKTCTNAQCPIGVGEKIVKQCQCVNEFSEALGYMSTLKEASQNMICTSGNKR
ncbi:MAG: hypothetical protein HY266_04630 [Deltaproteobacteria bacterium]|nr:hypothetical protein [Deltaproteobacteria bacterium]